MRIVLVSASDMLQQRERSLWPTLSRVLLSLCGIAAKIDIHVSVVLAGNYGTSTGRTRTADSTDGLGATGRSAAEAFWPKEAGGAEGEGIRRRGTSVSSEAEKRSIEANKKVKKEIFAGLLRSGEALD
jgi:hypothetical protein